MCAFVYIYCIYVCIKFYYNYIYVPILLYYVFLLHVSSPSLSPLNSFTFPLPSHSSSFSQHFLVQLQNWTGQDEVNMTNVFRIADIIRIHNVHNLSSYTPWATEEVRSKLYLISVYNLKLLFATAEMSRLACGECVCMCVFVCVHVHVFVYSKDVTILVLHIYSLQASWSTRSWMKCV